jgi:hypothetical protein
MPNVLSLLKTSLVVPLMMLHAVAVDAQERIIRGDCAETSMSLAREVVSSRSTQASSRLRACGAAAAPALAALMHESRRGADRGALEAIYNVAKFVRDDELFRSALETAIDGQAEVDARVYAFMYLYRLRYPSHVPTYAELVGSLDASGVPSAGCSSQRTAGSAMEDGVALRSDWIPRLQEAARGILKDRTTPTAIRSAAFCVQ